MTIDGKLLKRLMCSNEAFDILGDIVSWNSGGCWILAEALRRFIGDQATIVAIADDRCQHQHIVVKVGNLYYDADGESNEGRLLHRWMDYERLRNPRIVGFDPELAADLEIPCEEELVTQVYNLLNSRLKNPLFSQSGAHI
jgi:hypothetical protein